MAKKDDQHYELIQDKKGMYWDLLLYIPTVIALIIVAAKMWYSGDETFTYILVFMTTFIALIGFNRVAKTRLMILPKAPIALTVDKKQVSLALRNGDTSQLVKDLRFFSDHVGKSFGLVGYDLDGRKQQHVFHKGQFASSHDFDNIKAALRPFS